LRIAQPAEDTGQDDQTQQLSASGEHPPNDSPITQSAPFNMAASSSEIGATTDFGPERRDDFWRMLQIGIDDAEHIAARALPAPDNRSGEAPFVLSPHNSDLRINVGETLRNFPCPVRAVVINNNQFVASRNCPVQNFAKDCNNFLDVLSLIVGRQNQRKL